MPTFVGMVPVRSLLGRYLRNHTRLSITIVQRDTQGRGWQGAYKVVMLVINPSSVGMVPVRSLLFSHLQKTTPCQVSIHHRSTRHAGWGCGRKRTGILGSSSSPRALGWCP
jgi:hypothetical protein